MGKLSGLSPKKLQYNKNPQPFLSLVNQILAAQKKDPNADTSPLEHQIDQMVYKIYDLTPEEIEIVEGKR
jgi:hypothetical protein